MTWRVIRPIGKPIYFQDETRQLTLEDAAEQLDELDLVKIDKDYVEKLEEENRKLLKSREQTSPSA